MLFLRLVILLFLLQIGVCLAQNNTILVVGDSLSAAHGMELEQGWVYLLQKRLKNYGGEYTWNVVNASVSGETTAGGLARLPNLIEEHQPVLCIIELGANNGLHGQSIELMHSQLSKIVELCNSVGTSLLLGIKLPPNYGKKYTDSFHQSYIDISKKYDIPLVPFFLDGIALNDAYLQRDRLHPNAKAQPLILKNVWPSIKKLLESI